MGTGWAKVLFFLPGDVEVRMGDCSDALWLFLASFLLPFFRPDWAVSARSEQRGSVSTGQVR